MPISEKSKEIALFVYRLFTVAAVPLLGWLLGLNLKINNSMTILETKYSNSEIIVTKTANDLSLYKEQVVKDNTAVQSQISSINNVLTNHEVRIDKVEDIPRFFKTKD